jgi:hypothetical protein
VRARARVCVHSYVCVSVCLCVSACVRVCVMRVRACVSVRARINGRDSKNLGLLQLVLDEINDEIVGHELARVHVALGLM